MDKNSQLNQNKDSIPTDITVIIPTYNRSQFLIRALQSLVEQTDSDFDVIVCDDGSLENIESVTCKYAKILRLRFLRNEKSRGPGYARNLGLEMSQTTWISFLDSDDWWFPSKIEKVKESLTNEVDIIHHQLRVELASMRPETKYKGGSILGLAFFDADPLLSMIRFGNPLATSATTVRRDFFMEIGGFDIVNNLIEDFDAWIRLTLHGGRFKLIPEVLGVYRVEGDQMSKVTIKQYHRYLNLFNHQLKLLPEYYLVYAQSNFGYTLGSLALELGLSSSKNHFRQISFAKEPKLWIKARIKQFRMKILSFSVK